MIKKKKKRRRRRRSTLIFFLLLFLHFIFSVLAPPTPEKSGTLRNLKS